jgi:DNA-binding NarL/FixJ family response regulator
VRVAIADDSTLFRQGLALLLAAADFEVIAQAANGTELLEAVAADPPEVVIVDIRMPPTFTEEGLHTADALHERHPDVGVLLLSTYAESTYARRLIGTRAAGRGYMLKDRVDDIGALTDALGRIDRGETVIDATIVDRLMRTAGSRHALDRLTPREHTVLHHMAEGRSNAGIASTLFLSEKTVERHIATIFQKLDLPLNTDDNRRVLAVLSWMRHQPGDAPSG